MAYIYIYIYIYSGVRANHQQQFPINYLLEYCGHSPSSAKIHFYVVQEKIQITKAVPSRNSPAG